MRLGQLIAGAPSRAGEIEISGLAYDNRQVTPGTLFFCVPGFTRDGHDFAQEAIARGAAALVVERPLNLGVPEVQVSSVRAAMAPAAAAFYGDPTSRLQVVGVTGTNGKTTTAFLMHALLEAAGRQAGLLGTVKSVIGGTEHPVVRTTPEAIDLQATFREMLDAGDVACAMEVSSHALELRRADAIHFAAAIFTNLTQDHLDFHPSMEDYFLAKRRLFSPGGPAVAVVNVDDPNGRRLADRSRAERRSPPKPGRLWSRRGPDRSHSDSGDADRGAQAGAHLAATGRFNLYNVLGDFAAARELGIDADTAARAICTAEHVLCRFQTVEERQDFAVLVDYAQIAGAQAATSW